MKITLTLNEGIQLEAEILAILPLKAPIRLKYALTSLLLSVQARTAAGRKLAEQLFKEHGRPDVNNANMLVLDEGKALEDYKVLQGQSLEGIEFEPLKLEWFDGLESAHNFPVLFKFI